MMRSTTSHFSSKRSIHRFSINVYIISKSSTFRRRHKWKPQPDVTFQSCKTHIIHTSLQNFGLPPHMQVIPLDLYQLSHKYRSWLMFLTSLMHTNKYFNSLDHHDLCRGLLT
jgi:hypothetical protein